jgi:FtsH-binding integral membrane protein
MLGLMDFIVGIVELLVYWRLSFGLALTALACWLLVLAIPYQPAQWFICIPVGLVGMFFAFRWQHRADLDT